MAFWINPEECTACGLCEDACPTDAISENEDEDTFVIDPEACDDCGTCVDECPNDAIAEK